MGQKPPLTAIFCVMLTLTVLFGAAPGTIAAQSEYELSTADSVDTPTREITLRGATYEVSALGRADTGGSVDLTVDAQEDDFYRVYLYNSSQTPVIRESGTGDDTITFDLGDQAPGTYMFALQEQGTTEVIYPLVIKGYDIDLQTPNQVPADESFTADISLTRTDSEVAADRVEVVVAGKNSQFTEPAPENGDAYRATVSTDSLAEGSYSVYANVRSSNTVYDEQEILGVSATNEVVVGAEETNTDEENSTEEENTTDSNEPSGEIQDPEATEELPEPESSDENDQASTNSESDTSSSIPGFTPALTVISLLLSTLLIRIRR